MSFFTILLLIVGIVGIDQLIKLWAIANLMGNESIIIIPGLLKLTYLENYGAAFGIFDGMKWFLILITGFMLVGILFLLYKNLWFNGKFLRTCLAFIVAGGFGNLIDRIRLGYVVDYLDINDWFSYPIFNFADCFVVVGAVLMMVYVIFFDKGDSDGRNIS